MSGTTTLAANGTSDAPSSNDPLYHKDKDNDTQIQVTVVANALQQSLWQYTSGDIPRLLVRKQNTTTTTAAATTESSRSQKATQCSTTRTTTTILECHNNMDLVAWHALLQRVCHTALHATTPHPHDDVSHGKPWDVEVRICTTLFKRFTSSMQQQKQQRKRRKGLEQGKDKTTPTESSSSSQSNGATNLLGLQITSDYGVRRTVSSAVALAHLVWPHHLLPGWRMTVGPQGFVYAVSPRRQTALLAVQRQPCPQCSAWPTGQLWWHVQTQHNVSHATATAASIDTTRALVVYHEKPEPTTSSSTVDKNNVRMDTNPESVTTSATPISTDTTGTTSDQPLISQQAFVWARQGKLMALQDAVQQDMVDPMNDKDDKGATLLHWAAGAGHLSVVKYLVEDCGCSVRVGQQQGRQCRRGFAGRTALHWACRKGHLTVVQYLLQRAGIDALHDATADGTTAMAWAAWQGHQHVLDYLYDVMDSAQKDNFWQSVNHYGCTPLLWAAQGLAQPSTLEWLVDVASCSLTHVNANGHGVLHKAAQRNRADIVTWLQNYLLSTKHSVVDESCLALIAPDQEGCMPSDLAGMEGFSTVAMAAYNCECAVWRMVRSASSLSSSSSSSSVVQTDDSFPWTAFVDPTALVDEYGPGCGIARLYKVYRQGE